jgi:hypothetical protein
MIGIHSDSCGRLSDDIAEFVNPDLTTDKRARRRTLISPALADFGNEAENTLPDSN